MLARAINPVCRLSTKAHGFFWPGDRSQSICSRAYWKHGVDWRWNLARVILDAVFWVFERNHCARSFMRFH